MTDAELRNLLLDCAALWSVGIRVEAGDDGLAVHAEDGPYRIQAAPASLRPVRWFLQTPDRAAAGRPPRAHPSIVALLAALRNAVSAGRGSRLRIGPS